MPNEGCKDTPAIGHRLLRASAGTGKTYQLVEIYAGLVLEQGLQPAQIVTITFTRKAALELKTRIWQRLDQAQVPGALLRQLERAPISNFHGLALQLLRRWGLADVSGDGWAGDDQGADEEENRLLFCEACERTWFGDASFASAVQTLAPYVPSIDTALPLALWDALSRAREDGKKLSADVWGHYNPLEFRRHAHAELLALRDRMAQALLNPSGLSPTCRTKLEAFHAAPVPSEDAPVERWVQGWQAVYRLLDRRGGLGNLFTQEDQQRCHRHLTEVRAEALCAQVCPALVKLADGAWEAYEAAKRLYARMDFADMIEQLVEVLSSRKDLHQQVRQTYRAVLVDEAQDTNRLQRQLIHLLVGFQGPAASASAGSAGLCMVGDWKQSIYTFRGADPDSFALFAEDLRLRGGQESTLSVSRRACPALVEGINHLGWFLFAQRYEPLTALPGPTARPGAGMRWYEVEAASDEVPQALHEAQAVAQWLLERLKTGAAPHDFAVLSATQTHGSLMMQTLTEAGIPVVWAGGSGFYSQPEIKDMLALLGWVIQPQNRWDAAIALRSPLWGLTDAGLLALLSPSPAGEDRLAALVQGSWKTPLSGICAEDNDALSRAAALVPLLVQAALQPAVALGASDFLAYADAMLDIQAVYVGLPGGEQRLANLHRLFALAERWDRTQGGLLHPFVRQQQARLRRDHKEPVASPAMPKAAAVTLSSVHQSKGLQYPVVLLTGLAHKKRADTACVHYGSKHGLVFRARHAQESIKSRRWRLAQQHEASVQDEELKRLLYVAVTRAEREVVFISPPLEALGHDGLARFLGPWCPKAQRDKVLSYERLSVHPTPGAYGPKATSEIPPASRLGVLPAQAVAGTYFEFSVHQLVAQRVRQAQLRGEEPHGRVPWDHARLSSSSRLSAARQLEAVLGEVCQGVPTDDPTHVTDEAVLAFLRSDLGRLLASLPSEQRRHHLAFQLRLSPGPYTVGIFGHVDILYRKDRSLGLVVFQETEAPPSLRTELAELGHACELDICALAMARLCQVEGPVRGWMVWGRYPKLSVYERQITCARQRAAQVWIEAYVDRWAQGEGFSCGAGLTRLPHPGVLDVF